MSPTVLDEDEVVRDRVDRGMALDAIARKHGVSHYPVRRVLRERGVDTSRPVWTEDGAVRAVRAWSEARDGEVPTERRWRPAPAGCPGRTALYALFGSWANAMVACGFDPMAPGDHRRPATRDAFDAETRELAARHDAGETLTELAYEVGCTPQALGRRVRRWRRDYGVPTPPGSHTRRPRRTE